MPELPEIETIKRGLTPKLVGAQISAVELPFYKSLLVPSVTPTSYGSRAGASGRAPKKLVQAVERYIVGARIEHIDRRGKVLIWQLDNDYALLFHLKMSGQLVFVEPAGPRFVGGHPTPSMTSSLPDSSTRIIFVFAAGARLYFNDQRKFGWVKLVKKTELTQEPLLAKLAREPLADNFSSQYLAKQLKGRSLAIKAALLDQAIIAGVGNIYADEALHKARLHPATPAGELSEEELRWLVGALAAVMNKSVALGGTSFTSYVNALGKKGDYLKQARVFGRTGAPCPECGAAIQKLKVAQRGTHICPQCQKRSLRSGSE